MKKILLVVGARPNYMKAAPIMKALRKTRYFHVSLVHTGQHYDSEMSALFFRDLKLPEPDIHLGIGSGSHAEQTAKIMLAFEKVCVEREPSLVMVVGDVNSTVAAALVAVKLGIPVAHVEAGLRSFDRSMPEEINRVLTDQVSGLLFSTCRDANRNLIKEGIPEDRIFFVGNVMIDTLLRFRTAAEKSNIFERLPWQGRDSRKKYALLTLHRPSNVDDRATLKGILEALNELNLILPLVFPAHPRTMKRIRSFGLEKEIGFLTLPPLGYLDFLKLMAHARMVLTDSGGIQEETTILGVPCLTLRGNTERPITLTQGTNRLVGNRPGDILSGARKVLAEGQFGARTPELWDGRAAERIATVLVAKKDSFP